MGRVRGMIGWLCNCFLNLPEELFWYNMNSSGTKSKSDRAMFSPYKILIVEDDHVICSMLSGAFLSLGYEIVSAHDGFQALERIEAESFNVVLLDIMLPGPDGMDILKHLRKHYPQTQVIMLTAYASLDTALDALRLGAYDYITKPFKFDDLRSIVRRALEKQRLETKLDAIYDLSREMALSLSVNQVTEVVLDIIERVLEYETCHLMLIDVERDELYCFAGRGTEGDMRLTCRRIPDTSR
jgi:two-component system response regulator AtoC